MPMQVRRIVDQDKLDEKDVEYYLSKVLRANEDGEVVPIVVVRFKQSELDEYAEDEYAEEQYERDSVIQE